jgi:hypothetical protein
MNMASNHQNSEIEEAKEVAHFVEKSGLKTSQSGSQSSIEVENKQAAIPLVRLFHYFYKTTIFL